MKITTHSFGSIDINPEDIVQFTDGLPGFAGSKRFVILFPDQAEGEEISTICFLQSVDDEDLSLVMVDMTAFMPQYRPHALVEYARENDGPLAPDSLAVYNIVTVRDNLANSTVNLKAPVIIDLDKKIGKQIICQGDDYPIRAMLFNTEEDKAGGGAC
jgi:flagellar assembly factor FliW